MRSGWGRSSIVAVGQGSDCGGTILVVDEGVVGGVASGTGMGAGSGVPSVAGSPTGSVEVATTDSPCGLPRPGGCLAVPLFRLIVVR